MESHDPGQPSKNSQDPAKNTGEPTPYDPGRTTYVYEFADFRLDPVATPAYRLLLNGQPHKIQDKTFTLLRVLVENHQRELSNEELIGYVWKDEPAARANPASYAKRLHTQVKLLRKSVGGLIMARKGGGCYYINAPVKVIPRPQTPPPPVPDLDFEQWIVHSRESHGIKLFLCAGIALSLLYSAAYLWHPPALDPLFGLGIGRALSLIQLGIIIVALVVSFWVFDRRVKDFPASPEADAELMRISGYTDWDKWGRAKAGARSSLKRFSRYWKLLLVAWVCLYLLLSLPTSEASAPQAANDLRIPEWARSIALTVCNNCNSWMITLCFVVLDHPTVIRRRGPSAGHTQPDSDNSTGRHDADNGQETSLAKLSRQILVGGLLAVILFAVVEFLLVAPAHTNLFGPSWKPEVVFGPAWAPGNVLWAADFFSGIVGAVTLALFVGRIQSKFLGPSTWLPLAFFFYAAIQSLYLAIKTDAHWTPSWGPAMIEMALILKCLLYLYLAWLFKSGRLLFYLVKVRTVYERVNIDWHDFLAHLNREQ